MAETKNTDEIDPKEIDESLEEGEEPNWIREDKKESDYKIELFMSTDGKHTVHVVVDNPKSRREAVKKAMEMYDYVVARYGTKQAQAVREYSNGKKEVEKPDQDSCKHVDTTFKQSKTEKNPGRWFKTCQSCSKFLGWQS